MRGAPELPAMTMDPNVAADAFRASSVCEDPKASPKDKADATRKIVKWLLEYRPPDMAAALLLIQNLRESYLWHEKMHAGDQGSLKEMTEREHGHLDEIARFRKARKGGPDCAIVESQVSPELIKDLEDLGRRLGKLEEHVRSKQTPDVKAPQYTEYTVKQINAHITKDDRVKCLRCHHLQDLHLNGRSKCGALECRCESLSTRTGLLRSKASDKKASFVYFATDLGKRSLSPAKKGPVEICPDCGAKNPNPDNFAEIDCVGCGETFLVDVDPYTPPTAPIRRKKKQTPLEKQIEDQDAVIRVVTRANSGALDRAVATAKKKAVVVETPVLAKIPPSRESQTRLRCGKPCRHGKDEHRGADHTGPCKICGPKKCKAFRPVGPAGKAWLKEHEKLDVTAKPANVVKVDRPERLESWVAKCKECPMKLTFPTEKQADRIMTDHVGRKGHIVELFRNGTFVRGMAAPKHIIAFAAFKKPQCVGFDVSWSKVPGDMVCLDPDCDHIKYRHGFFATKGQHACEVDGCKCKDFWLDAYKVPGAMDVIRKRVQELKALTK